MIRDIANSENKENAESTARAKYEVTFGDNFFCNK